MDNVWVMLLETFGIVVASCLFVGVIAVRAQYGSLPEQRAAIELTLKHQRSLGGPERTAVALKLLEFNAELAVLKYWNDFWMTDLFIPDRSANLEPIR